MISSLLNIMANAVRPPLLRSSNERQTRLNFLPVSRDDALQQAQRNNNNTPVATRRTSKSGPLLALADDDRSVKQLTHTPNKPPPPARTSSRKRPATALEDDATDTRPPTKITVTQPHGELLRITKPLSERSPNSNKVSRMDSTADAAYELDTPPGTASSASKTITHEVTGAAHQSDSSATQPGAVESASLAGYASQSREDRQTVLDEFMISKLEDPNFAVLCEDLDTCWRKIALGL